MPAIGRVVENEKKGDGTITSLVEVTAIHETGAKNRAKNTALLYNGYSHAVSGGKESSIGVEIESVEETGQRVLRSDYEVVVVLSGAGPFFEGIR